ncbi:phytoene/squalene synthase family protein [Sphingomonas sp. ID1715]|uniref:phytoene/squalene synthase family protein n=1 Tax=Sphingomonas sp. ID1715 TaxID=1656898 RepID=UPI001489DD1A|nr:phytoene/squalene synthase family protein [Sphingomonas sp. ID1715]NNM78662.1 phytoene/squalene synthase family protein [Sphingomonas sp. ID1715]
MSSSSPSREAIVATARETTARGSKSFSLASRLFDRRTRERAWLLYAWCRACDDLADGQHMGGTLGEGGEIDRIRDLTDRALGGEWVGEASFDGLRLLCEEVPIPRALIDDHIAGFALDAEGWRPRTEADLIRYCHHVAGAVGEMMALVMGVPPEDADTMKSADDLGIAFQLANIARDVTEDAQGGRCYLPEEWLRELNLRSFRAQSRNGFSTALEANGEMDAVVTLTRRLADLSAQYEASAQVGARRLPFRSRWAVLAAAGIYGDIAREVARQGVAALDRRVVTSRRAKLGWVFRALKQAL